jgi:hypothetical protein
MTQESVGDGRLHDRERYSLGREARDHLRRAEHTNEGRLNGGFFHSNFPGERAVPAIANDGFGLIFCHEFLQRESRATIPGETAARLS